MTAPADAVTAFAEAMRAAGIEPPAKIEDDGGLHRFPTNGERHDDAGWYVLHLDGIPAGAFGDWRSGIEGKWYARPPETMTPAERAAHCARIGRARQVAEAERDHEREIAAKRARAVWSKATPACADHPYLSNKRVKPTTTLREMQAETIKSVLGYAPAVKGEPLAGRVLIAPIVIAGKLASIEMIDESGRKSFLKGGAVAGGYWMTGRPPADNGDGEGTTFLIGEGVATVLSAAEATGHTGVAALFAGNLAAVAEEMRAGSPRARLVMLADLDASGVGLAKATEAARSVGGFVAVPDFGEARPETAKDFNDMAALRGLEAVRAAIEAAREPEPEVTPRETQTPAPSNGEPVAIDDDAAEIMRLAKLSPIECDRQLKDVARRLGCRVSTLAAAVKAARGDSGAAGQGRALELPEPELWPLPVDGAELLDRIVAAVRRYVVLEPGTAESIALWVMHAHALDAFGISPRLAITSPRAGCGKTTLLDVLSHLVPRALPTANISAAAIYRTIEEAHPSLLVDEADSFLLGNDEMRGVLNSGHRRGGTVIRVVGDNLEPRQFTTWGAAAIAMIGKLPGTLADRSIPIALKRKRPDEPTEQFRFDRTKELDELASMAARWAKDNLARLREMDPLVPDSLSNRQADNWRVLLTIADAAGGTWPGRAREIAASMVDADQSRRTLLLADTRDVFASKGVDQISSADLVAALVEIEGHDWGEYRNSRPLTPNALARLLADDGIRPGTVRVGSSTPKGYKLTQFAEAFERYLPTP
jgi:putative DNA primase/helicase